MLGTSTGDYSGRGCVGRGCWVAQGSKLAVVPAALTRLAHSSLMLCYFQNLSELRECFFSSCCLELYFWVVSHRILHTAVLVQPISAEHSK